MTINANDPRLTAYALGELDDDARSAIEAELQESAEARHAVYEIHRVARLLTDELGREPMAGLTEEHRRVIETRMAQVTGPPGQPRRRRLSRTRLAWLASGAAAAVLLGFVVVRSVVPPLKRARYSAPFLALRTPETPARPRSAPAAPSDGRETPLAPTARGPAPSEREIRLHSTMAFSVGLDRVALGTAGYRVPDRSCARVAHDADAFNTEAYDHIGENPFCRVSERPLSTFSTDVDTASYANVRRFLTQDKLPPRDAVRIEEMINYFTYDYPQPDGEAPFSVNVEVADCPWELTHQLVRIGLKGYEIPHEDRPPSNLVFLLDVSGSMSPPNKLPLLRRSMRMLVQQLDERDRVAIVVYAGASGLVLPSTTGDDQEAILAALDQLKAGGSTNGGSGIQLAYDVAGDNFIEGGVNRIVLATDGDFNVGVTNQGDLIRLIEDRATSGVFLSVLGFGGGNYKDSTLEKLADRGNGNYAYIDTLSEARKVLVEQMGGTLITIAKDVKIQVEFNPAVVGAYRLIGYENRMLAAEDFNDDTKDAGEIGAGHTVTALYEIVGADQELDLPTVDALKYQITDRAIAHAGSDELMTVKLRYKLPDSDESTLMEYPVPDEGGPLDAASADFRFAASVAAFGMLLRDSQHKGQATFETVFELAEEGASVDEGGHRSEFIDLVERAAPLSNR